MRGIVFSTLAKILLVLFVLISIIMFFLVYFAKGHQGMKKISKSAEPLTRNLYEQIYNYTNNKIVMKCYEACKKLHQGCDLTYVINNLHCTTDAISGNCEFTYLYCDGVDCSKYIDFQTCEFK